MTNRAGLEALSNKDFAIWIKNLMDKDTDIGPCSVCPAYAVCEAGMMIAARMGNTRDLPSCVEVIADWLRAEK